MGSMSVSTCRGRVHWLGFLLVVSLLTFWCLPTNAQLSIVSTNVAKGKNVRLILYNIPPNLIRFRWFRGGWVIPHNLTPGYIIVKRKVLKRHLYNGQKVTDLDEPLLIRKAARKARGIYTVMAHYPNSVQQEEFRRLDVFRPVKVPILLTSNGTNKESKNAVVLTCYTNADSIEWFFNGMNLRLSERRKLSEDHRSLTIDPIQREDSGYYQCKVSNPMSSAESWPLELHMKHE